MIVDVKDYDILYRISRMVGLKEFEKMSDYTADQFFRYLIDRFDSDSIKVFAYTNGKKSLEGVAVCSKTTSVVGDKPQLFIDFAWLDKQMPKEARLKLWEAVEDYARALGTDEVVAYTTLQGRGLFSTYGFKRDFTAYIKKIPEKKKETSDEKQEKLVQQ